MRCAGCGRYTLLAECPECGAPASKAEPQAYSPQDRHGKYRRGLLYEGSDDSQDRKR